MSILLPHPASLFRCAPVLPPAVEAPTGESGFPAAVAMVAPHGVHGGTRRRRHLRTALKRPLRV